MQMPIGHRHPFSGVPLPLPAGVPLPLCSPSAQGVHGGCTGPLGAGFGRLAGRAPPRCRVQPPGAQCPCLISKTINALSHLACTPPRPLRFFSGGCWKGTHTLLFWGQKGGQAAPTGSWVMAKKWGRGEGGRAPAAHLLCCAFAPGGQPATGMAKRVPQARHAPMVALATKLAAPGHSWHTQGLRRAQPGGLAVQGGTQPTGAGAAGGCHQVCTPLQWGLGSNRPHWIGQGSKASHGWGTKATLAKPMGKHPKTPPCVF